MIALPCVHPTRSRALFFFPFQGPSFILTQECLSACVEVSRTVLSLRHNHHFARTNNPSQKGICAGKHAIAEYLIEHQGFRLLELASQPSSRTITDEPDDHLRLQASQVGKTGATPPEHIFQTPESLLDFVTKHWQQRWVTTDIADGETLDRFILRPFFLLVSVDAPVSLRWKRFSDRFVVPDLYLYFDHLGGS